MSATVATIDQTESERRLHRALYFVKYLRAMILNLFLGIVALALLAVAGIRGLYPLADDSVDALAAQIDMLRRQGDPFGAHFVAVVAVASGLFVLAFFAWAYFSITGVWRRSLVVQAAVLLLAAAAAPFSMGEQLAFSLAHLSPAFTALVVLSALFVIAMSADVALALWGVSRSPERSSFVATLDRRLAPGAWALLNKLLDLPRTPLRGGRTAAAYALAVGGAILLIACIAQLLTFGGAGARLSRLYAACAPGFEAGCLAEARARSVAWSWEILLWLALSLVGLRVGALMQSIARRLGGLGVADVLRGADDRFLLYLRPFDTDDVVLPKPRLPPFSRLVSFRPFPARVEEELFDVADGYRPLIAVGRPGTAGAASGGQAYRIFLADSEWQDYVADKIRRAEAIVMVIKDTDGVRWELDRVLREGAAAKTLFLFDPGAREPASGRALAAVALAPLAAAGLVAPDFAWSRAPLGFFLRDGQPVAIVNANWSATSYRTAFSSFLAERAIATRRPAADDRGR